MLEKLDLEQKLPKDEYNQAMEKLGLRLGQVQRQARDLKRPVIILFEGWRGARRSLIINKMMQEMDARGFRVLSSLEVASDEPCQPFFTYFWKNLPAKGHIAVYHRGWYYLKNYREFVDKENKQVDTTTEHINAFEKTLVDDGYILIKFFLHLSRKKQKSNLTKRSKTLGKAWKDKYSTYDDSDDYDKYLECYEKLLEATDTAQAPWNLVTADDTRSAQVSVIGTIVDILERELTVQPKAGEIQRSTELYDVLSRVDLQKTIAKEKYKAKLDEYQNRLKQLQIDLFRANIPAVIGFEGWDAAGKGGAIRRLTAALDPLGYVVHPIVAPNELERQYHYLWRFWSRLNVKGGRVTIFDRTWYGRVMVERIEGFAQPYEWQRAYDEIKDMEAQWADSGIAIAKFWLQIDKDEQYRRFQEREGNPDKQWKITEEDWRNREKWSQYEEAVNEMLVRTDTSYAPWTIVEGNDKYYARLKVLETVINLFEEKLAKRK